ncbi:MAG: hypothetical protein ACXWWL_06265, partial [Candidatus Limnocylindria bacterium]
MLLAVAGVARRAVLRVVVLRFVPVVVLRFAPLLDAREVLADRAVRLLPLRADAVFVRAGFLAPAPFRLDALAEVLEAFRLDALAELFEVFGLDALAELLVRVLPLCGVVPAMSIPLISAIDRCVRGTHSPPQRRHVRKLASPRWKYSGCGCNGVRESRTGGSETSDTPTCDAKLVQLLNEAYTKEKQLETSLQAHVDVTTREDYAKRLKDHLKETK